MKKILTGILLSVSAITAVVGLMASTDGIDYTPGSAPDGALRTMPNVAFGYGEKLYFDVGYKMITAGKAIMQVGGQPATVSGRPCYPVRFDVYTTSTFDNFFKVRDLYRTYIDIDGIFPWRFEQVVREGNYSRDFSAIIDQRNHTAKTTEGSFKAAPFVHDILSAFYYVRALDLKGYKKGQSLSLQNFYGKQAHELRVRFLGREQVTVDAGTFNCIVIEPLVVEGGLFKNEGRILVWLTDDDRKIPVKVSTKVVIGSIDAKLTAYAGTRGPVSAKQ